MLSEWNQLLEQIKIDGSVWTCSSESDLRNFETRTGIVLPTAYKEFCQVFGSGEFDLLFIYAIAADDPPMEIHTEDNLECLMMQDPFDYDEALRRNLERLKALVSHSLLFGANGDGSIFFWDLETYSSDDESYDIYVASFDDYSDYKIGRSFFNFVRDICLGDEEYSSLPENFRPQSKYFPKTFRIGLSEDDLRKIESEIY
jgi:hypothetical protein